MLFGLGLGRPAHLNSRMDRPCAAEPLPPRAAEIGASSPPNPPTRRHARAPLLVPHSPPASRRRSTALPCGLQQRHSIRCLSSLPLYPPGSTSIPPLPLHRLAACCHVFGICIFPSRMLFLPFKIEKHGLLVPLENCLYGTVSICKTLF
jgi:hypothetical protein